MPTAGDETGEGDSPQAASQHDSAKAQPKEPRSVITKDINDTSKPEVPEADEFGLPVRTTRRRNFSLDELDSPEEIKKQVLDETIARLKESPQRQEPETNGEHGGQDQLGQAEDAVDVDEAGGMKDDGSAGELPSADPVSPTSPKSPASPQSPSSPLSRHAHGKASIATVSECSPQKMAPRESKPEENDDDDEGEWQEMPALATHRVYDDWGKVIVKSYDEVDDERYAYGNLGGAGRGYTRVQIDEDAQSATSLDDNTAYLFKDKYKQNTLDEAEDDDSRDILSQMQTTKQLLTESQRIAYVGIVRLSLVKMTNDMGRLPRPKSIKKQVDLASEALKMWGQKMMVRLYSHMEVDPAEQIMVEQLAEHGVIPADLTPALMQNARIKSSNLEADRSDSLPDPSSLRPARTSPRPSSSMVKDMPSPTLSDAETPAADALPAYEDHAADELVYQDPEDFRGAQNIDLDIRWTVLCDLFLLLLGDGAYDARSRTLLEHVGSSLAVDWQEICRFEKRVTDALEVQEEADKENWNEDDHLKAREKAARKRRMVVMGLCTVGGGLVIGLSAGLLAPVIGAGLAAGFTGIGVAGTSSFLTGTGAAALIGTTGTLIGGRIGVQTSDRRTGAVKTFEYKPLFNNKRTNLIVTVAGWMTGKVDDVRLPFSTINPIMGDIYSVNWEPEMLQSTGETIQILATEALTQTIQQILGATVLGTLMAGLSLPIVLTKISYLIDNPWTVSLARADSTGLILADSMIDRNLGVRPITLVGFSLGCRVIFSCLKELARRGAVGLVQNVYMFGSPIVAKKDDYTRARSIVSGRFVNGYATNDWILGYLFRATSGGIARVAGLASVDVPGIDNIDVTENVPGHTAYRGMMPILLDQVGWEIENFEFSEIDDPDPDNHENRQRELLNEIEEARRQLDQQPEKKGFKAFFSRKKAAQKKVWETYDERSTRVLNGDEAESERVAMENSTVMFDVDAIRREALALALQNPDDLEEIKKHLSFRQVPTTLPALKVTLPSQATNDTPAVASASSNGTRPDLQQSQSHNGTYPKRNGFHSREDSHADDEVTLSFESPERPYTSPGPNPWSEQPASPTPPERPEQSWTLRGARSGVSERPNIRSVSSSPGNRRPPSPQPVVSPDRGRSPLHDEYEFDFGREKEMEMTFE